MPGANPGASGADAGVGAGFGFPDFSEAGASELLGLMGEADQNAHVGLRGIWSPLVGALLAMLEGPGAAVDLKCRHQLGVIGDPDRARRTRPRRPRASHSLPGVLGRGARSAPHLRGLRLGCEKWPISLHKRAHDDAQTDQQVVKLDLGGWQVPRRVSRRPWWPARTSASADDGISGPRRAPIERLGNAAPRCSTGIGAQCLSFATPMLLCQDIGASGIIRSLLNRGR